MQELLPRALREVVNGPLRDSILEIGIYSAKGEFLSRFLTRADEGGVCEMPIIAVVMGDLVAVLRGETLERVLGVDGLL